MGLLNFGDRDGEWSTTIMFIGFYILAESEIRDIATPLFARSLAFGVLRASDLLKISNGKSVGLGPFVLNRPFAALQNWGRFV